MRVHATLKLSANQRAVIEDAAPGITWGKPVPRGLDVLVRGVPSADDLAAIVPGGALVIPYAGLPTLTRDHLAERTDLRVYNLHHNADLVAEHTLALVLAVSRRIVPIDRALRQGDWRARWAPDDCPVLRGKQAVIVGYGAIGQRVGAALEGLGMQVVGLRRSEGPGLDALNELLPNTRVLVLAVPHTPDTEGLVSAERLARCPADLVLVNIARGAVCDEAALYAALRDGQIYGAGLDVWWRYPDPDARDDTPPAELPFHELENVVLSPHRAGHASATEDLRADHLSRLLGQLLAGQEPDTRVDPVRGY